MDRRKRNIFNGQDSSVDPVRDDTSDKKSNFLSHMFPNRELGEESRPSMTHGEFQQFDHSERLERQMQQSAQLINQKKYMQQQLFLMQQQKQQQKQQQQQQQQPQQQSPEWQQQDAVNRKGDHISSARSESPPSVVLSQSFEDMTVHDMFAHCQNHLNVINACTDLQQTIKDEMKKQAKLDNNVCRKFISKAQRLHQRAVILEKVNAPEWVGQALLELGAQVNQQAEIHHIYTTTLLEQCVVIQHSLDGHQELMKSVLAQSNATKTNPNSTKNDATDKLAYSANMPKPIKRDEFFRSMTFLQASTIFEGIRQPRMKLISSLEYQQEQMNATVGSLEQVLVEIEELSMNEDSDSPVWKTQLQKKDLELRKDFLEARKEQLESDVQFARMDLNHFEFSHKDRMMEILNVFRQHRARYDTTLKQSFQLLKAASLRDVSFLRKLTKKGDFDVSTDHEAGDKSEINPYPRIDPWTLDRKTPSTGDTSTTTHQSQNDQPLASFKAKPQKSPSPRISLNSSAYHPKPNVLLKQRNNSPNSDKAYQSMMSTDSEISFTSKSEVQSVNQKKFNSTMGVTSKGNPFRKVSDYNFSRSELSSSTTEKTQGKVKPDTTSAVSDSSESLEWNVSQEAEPVSSVECLNYENQREKLIIAKYGDNSNTGKNISTRSQIKTSVDDILIMRSGTKSVHTLGNFENCINNESDSQCVHPMRPIRDLSYNREDKRVTRLINKYAATGSRTCLGKNWNSSYPLVWCGISNGIIREHVSRPSMSRGLSYFEGRKQHRSLTTYRENKHFRGSQPIEIELESHTKNELETWKGHSDKSFNRCESLSEQNDVNGHNLSTCDKSHEMLTEQENQELSTEQENQELFTGTKNQELPKSKKSRKKQASKKNHQLSAGKKNNNRSSKPKKNALLTEQKSHGLPTVQMKSESVTALSSNGGLDHCESATESGSICSDISHMTSEEQNAKCHEFEADCAVNTTSSGEDLLEKHSLLQSMDNCDIISGHVSRNLNNCEPLKIRVVGEDSVMEGEDRLEFEITQVLFPVAQCRNIKVCAVRPIPSEAEGGGQEKHADVNQNTDKETHSKRTTLAPYKFDNLKLFEVTAGQYMVLEQETEVKKKIISNEITENSCNHKQTCFCEGDSLQYPNQTYSRKMKPCSHYDYTRLDETTESDTELQSGINYCETVFMATVATEQSESVMHQTLTREMVNNETQFGNTLVYETAGAHQHTRHNNIRGKPADTDNDISSTVSKPKLFSENLPHFSNSTKRRESAKAAPNVVQSGPISNDNVDEEETFPKTAYVSDVLESKVACTHNIGNSFHPTDVEDVPGANLGQEDQNCARQALPSATEHGTNAVKLIKYASKDDSSIFNVRPKLPYTCVKDNNYWTRFIEDDYRVEAKLDLVFPDSDLYDERSISESFSPDSLELELPVSVHSEYQLNQLYASYENARNLPESLNQETYTYHQSFEDNSNTDLHQQFEDYNTRDCRSRESYSTEKYRAHTNDKCYQNTQLFLGSNRFPNIKYPLKSSLKKTSPTTCQLNVESGLYSGYHHVFPYGIMSLDAPITEELCLQTHGQALAMRQTNKEAGQYQNSGKTHKSSKQVRFDDIIQYNDCTEDTTKGPGITNKDITSTPYSVNEVKTLY